MWIANLPPSSYEQQEITIELRVHLQEYRAVFATWSDQPDTLQQTRMIERVELLKNFLERAKNELFEQAKENGWPPYWERGYALGSGYQTVYQSLMQSIHNFLAEPGIGSAHMINEQLTQLLWLLTHQNTQEEGS